MKIKLHIKSYYVFYLNQFIINLNVCLTKYFLKHLHLKKVQVFLPLRIEKYTLLRSPHADKKARDQFERRTHKRLIVLEIPGISKQNIYFLNLFFQNLNSLAFGVEYRIIYEY